FSDPPTKSGSLLAGFPVERTDLVGHLRALLDPCLDLGRIQFEAHFLAGRDRVEVADALDVAAVTRVAAVGDDDVIERTPLGAAAGKANLDHCKSLRIRKFLFGAGPDARCPRKE